MGVSVTRLAAPWGNGPNVSCACCSWIRCGLGFFFDQLAAGAAQELLDEVGRIDPPAEIRVLQNGLLERDSRFYAGNHVFVESAAHLVHGFTPVSSKSDKFADHGIIS